MQMRLILPAVASVLALVTTFDSASAEPSYRVVSLSEALQSALKNDPKYAAAAASLQVGLEKENIAFGGLLPTITASAAYYPGSTTESRVPNSTSILAQSWRKTEYDYETRSVLLRQPLVRLRNWATYLQGKTQADQARAQYRYDRYQAILRLVQSYTDWLEIETQVRSGEAKSKFAAARLAQVIALRANSRATLTDELKAKADNQQSLFELMQYQKDLSVAVNRFQQLVGAQTRPQGFFKNLELKESTIDRPEWSLNALREEMLLHNPEIIALRLSIKSTEWEVRKARADHLPTVDFVASYAQENNASSVALGQETKTSTVGLQLNIPIFQGGVISSTTRQAVAELQRLEAELIATEQRLMGDLIRTHAAIASSAQLYRFAVDQRTYAEENLRSIKEQRRLGFKSSVDLNNAEQVLATSQYDEARALAQWVVAKVSMLALTGRLDEFDGKETELVFAR